MTRRNIAIGAITSALGYGILDQAGYPGVFWVFAVACVLAGAIGVAYRNIA